MKEVINKQIMDGLVFVSTHDAKDGGMVMSFDIQEQFKKYFCKQQGLKKFSNKRFEKWINEILMQGMDLLEKDINKKSCSK